MRQTRSSVLSKPSGIIHLIWRCHNRERLLALKGARELFFKNLIFGLFHRNSDRSVKLHAFCLMGNHVHHQMSYSNGVAQLSHVLRVAHGRFGRMFNDRFKRSGAVGNDRPKTPLIENTRSQMRVHFYIEANPIRAGIIKLERLRDYFWNSYRFYAYGEVDDYTQHLTPPEWYLELGDTPEKRQKKYRALFIQYLDESIEKSGKFLGRFIGSDQWIAEQLNTLRAFMRTQSQRRREEPGKREGAGYPPVLATELFPSP